MMEFSINVVNWGAVARDRGGWRATVSAGAKGYAENNSQGTIVARQNPAIKAILNSGFEIELRPAGDWDERVTFKSLELD